MAAAGSPRPAPGLIGEAGKGLVPVSQRPSSSLPSPGLPPHPRPHRPGRRPGGPRGARCPEPGPGRGLTALAPGEERRLRGSRGAGGGGHRSLPPPPPGVGWRPSAWSGQVLPLPGFLLTPDGRRVLQGVVGVTSGRRGQAEVAQKTRPLLS